MTTINSPIGTVGLASVQDPTASPVLRTVASLGIALLRLHLQETLRAGVFTEAERDQAFDNVQQMSDAARLQVWQRNLQRVKQEREAAQLAVAVAERERRDRTGDYVAEQSASRAEREFTSESGLTWAEVCAL